MMETNVQLLQCGACGYELVRVYIKSRNELITECAGCHSTTDITCATPKLEVSFGKASEGMLLYIKSRNELITECAGCHSTTDITCTTPELELSFGKDSEGMLCVFSK